MAGSIEITGLEEFTRMLHDMTIDETDESKAVRKAIDIVASEVEKNTPVGYTGRLKKIKKTVKKEGFAVVGTVKMGAFYDIFQEFGTSQSKKNVGFFEKSVENSKDEAIKLLGNELLDKIK